MTYLVKVEGQYVDYIAVDGYGTNADDSKAVVLTYNEAVALCYRINVNAGKIDKAVMVEAIEEVELEEEELTEQEKRENALMEYADDNWRGE